MDRQRPKSNGSSCSKGKCTGKPGSPCCVKGCCGEKQNSRHDHEKANECSNWRPSNQTSSKVANGHPPWRGFNLRIRNELEKLVPPHHAHSPCADDRLTCNPDI